jgi:hypothetical protein
MVPPTRRMYQTRAIWGAEILGGHFDRCVLRHIFVVVGGKTQRGEPIPSKEPRCAVSVEDNEVAACAGSMDGGCFDVAK